MKIPLSSPDITEADIDAVVSVLRTPRLSLGPKLIEFERSVADYTNTAHAIALSSGTAGLHLCLQALGVGENDEVILPSFTFIAAAHAVLYQRAIPVFVDIDPFTLNLDPADVAAKITLRTRAILVVHTFGRPADLASILEIADRRNIPVIEDACEALGAEVRVGKVGGRKVGAIARAGIFAFYPNKPITTGEGGMVVTNDRDLAGTIRGLRNQGRRESDGWLDHTLLGYSHRLSELNCALGVSQMSRLEHILARRENRAREYAKHLRAIPEALAPQLEIDNARICWFVFVVQLDHRDFIYDYMTARGIGCGRYFAPIHRQPLYTRFASEDLPVTDRVSASTLALPFFNAITDDQISEVCATLHEAIRAATSASH